MDPSEIGKRLSKRISGTVVWDKDSRDFYSVDASSYILKPVVIAIPKDKSDIIRIVKFASRYGVSLTPRGAGTGLVGSALGNGIIVDMRNLNKIRIGPSYVQVEAGVFKGDLDKVLQKHHKFLGPNPSIGPFCTLGGMIATNASGSHSLKYGSTIDNLIQVKMVTASGKVVVLPNHDNQYGKEIIKIIPPKLKEQFPKVSKNSCGYRIDKINSTSNLQKIIAGSEGTLGIIISARLKTYPIAKKLLLVVISYKTIIEAVKDVPNLIRLKPAAIELLDTNIAKYMKIKTSRNGCLLFVEIDNNTDASKSLIKLYNHPTRNILKMTSNKQEIKKLWSFRNSSLSYSLKSISKHEKMPTLIEDVTVPIRRLPLLLKLLDFISQKYNLRLIIYGHVGNGNLHIRPILKKKERQVIKNIALEFFSGVIGIGGCITGEHGDGLARSEFVKLQYGNEVYSVFKEIKKRFDPKNILNPGKIISNESTVTRNLKI